MSTVHCKFTSLGGGVGDLTWSTHHTSNISSILATLVDFDRFLEIQVCYNKRQISPIVA